MSIEFLSLAFPGRLCARFNILLSCSGVGWIEREMNAVKHSYEDEARLLDAEVAELRAKQRQANSYILELRKRFEENMRSIYRCDACPDFAVNCT